MLKKIPHYIGDLSIDELNQIKKKKSQHRRLCVDREMLADINKDHLLFRESFLIIL